jgi:hypothetical protein
MHCDDGDIVGVPDAVRLKRYIAAESCVGEASHVYRANAVFCGYYLYIYIYIYIYLCCLLRVLFVCVGQLISTVQNTQWCVLECIDSLCVFISVCVRVCAYGWRGRHPC